MAYRRCLLIRGNLDRKCRPSFSYVFHSDERKRERPDEKSSSVGISNFIQIRSFGSSLNESMGFVASSRDKMLSNRSLSPCSGYNFSRNMSTVNEGSDKIDIMTDVADVLTEATMEAAASQAPIVDEVAIAAADSLLPVKLLQYVIDGVHSYTGLDWWAAIVLTTLLIRIAAVPLEINVAKAKAKLTLMRPKMAEIKQQMQDKDTDPAAAAEAKKQYQKLFYEYGVTPLTPLKWAFIENFIVVSYFFAMTNMAEKMPSFKHGGAFWFIDLSTPDALYIFPVLTALLFLIRTEVLGVSRGTTLVFMRKNISTLLANRVLAALLVPFTMVFPKVIFFYLFPSYLFTLVLGFALKNPGVRKSFGLPERKKSNKR